MEPQTARALTDRLDPQSALVSGGATKNFHDVRSRLLNLLNVRYVLMDAGDDPNDRVDLRQEASNGVTAGPIHDRPGRPDVHRPP